MAVSIHPSVDNGVKQGSKDFAAEKNPLSTAIHGNTGERSPGDIRRDSRGI